jgi:hypothetical protein
MTTSDSFRALQRANPRHDATLAESVEHVAGAVRSRVATDTEVAPDSRPRRRLVGASAAAAAVAVAGVAAFLTIGSPGGDPGIENATAAVQRAATVTARSAEQSGTAVVRMTDNGEFWAGKTVTWNGADVAIAETPDASRPGRGTLEMRVVDGRLYGPDADGSWLMLGSPDMIDPGSGTTPAEYLAAVREDVGGATLRRFTRAMAGLTTNRLADGSSVYRGTVPAGAIARETGFKEGQHIRVLPFGYVAHDEAENPQALLHTAVTVGPEGVVREIAVTWGPAWRYTVTYTDLGTTPAPVAPESARSLLKERADRQVPLPSADVRAGTRP